jgi:hypothetical protein
MAWVLVASLVAFVGVMLWVEDGAAKSRSVFLILGFYTGAVAVDGLRRGVVLGRIGAFDRRTQPTLFFVNVAACATLSLVSVVCAFVL